MECGSRVVEDGVDEDFEVGEFEGVPLSGLEDTDSSVDDRLEKLLEKELKGIKITEGVGAMK